MWSCQTSSVSSLENNYMSCLLLPLFHVIGDRANHTIEMKYFIVREDHKEMISDKSFKMPSIVLREKEDPLHSENDLDEAMVIEATTVCTDCNRCLEFVGKRVNPIADIPFGIVTHFRHVRSIPSIETALWTVKYYSTEECTGNARKQEAIGYYELVNRLMTN